MAKHAPPTIARLRQLLSYDLLTGILTWRARTGAYSDRWNKRHARKEAGSLTPLGYRVVKVDGVNIGSHRAAWALTYGYWPELIDHINGDPADNRLSNLRAVSFALNQRNQKRHRSNTSGRTGVVWNRFRQIWVAQIKLNNRSIYLGSFDCVGQAIKARVRAEQKNGFTGRQ